MSFKEKLQRTVRPDVETYKGLPIMSMRLLLQDIIEHPERPAVPINNKADIAADILFLTTGDQNDENSMGWRKRRTFQSIRKEVKAGEHNQNSAGSDSRRDELRGFLQTGDNLNWFIGFLSHADVISLAETARKITYGTGYPILIEGADHSPAEYYWTIFGVESKATNLFGSAVRSILARYEECYPIRYEHEQQAVSRTVNSRIDYNALRTNPRNVINGTNGKEPQKVSIHSQDAIIYEGLNEEDLDYVGLKERTVVLSLRILGILPFNGDDEIEHYIAEPNRFNIEDVIEPQLSS